MPIAYVYKCLLVVNVKLDSCHYINDLTELIKIIASKHIETYTNEIIYP